MPVRFLSDAEIARLSGWPDELADDDLVTFFTLTSDDLGWLRSNVRAENRLGAAVQLCALPWLGWIPDDLSGCTSAAVDRLTSRARENGHGSYLISSALVSQMPRCPRAPRGGAALSIDACQQPRGAQHFEMPAGGRKVAIKRRRKPDSTP